MGWAALAIGLFTTGAGIFGANKQESVDKDRAQLGYEDNLEKIRRREFAQEQTLGKTKMLTEASGVRHSGGSTAQGYLDTMANEFSKELSWMKDYARQARGLGMKSASVTASANRFGALQSGLSAGSSVYGMGG